MSAEGSPRSLKRAHASFQEVEAPELEQMPRVPAELLAKLTAEEDKATTGSLPTPPVSVGTKREKSRTRSTTGSLTDAGTVTPSRNQSPATINPPATSDLPASSAFTALNGSASPPPKKAKLSFQEQEIGRIIKEIKDKENAEKKLAQEEKRKKREEEKLKTEEEKKKKDKGQMKLGSFFTMPARVKPRASSVDSKGRTSMSPAPQSSNSSAVVAGPMKTPNKPEKSVYEKMFPDFYIKHNVTLAPINRFERDEEAIGAIESTLDGYLLGNRSPGRQRTFDAPALFYTSSLYDTPRGKRYVPVREIMNKFYSGNSAKPIDLTADSQNSQIKKTADLLKGIPIKILHFQEDIRPPYRGTYTSQPVTGTSKLARNPLRRDLPNTNYDYDSEAEWVQDDEDAEDLKSEGDEEEELGEDEDMDDFLDDENDETANSRRLVLQGDLEPVSTGLCWENRKRGNSNVKMIAYRMEVMLDLKSKSIDPFSTAYWDPPVSTRTSMEPPPIPLDTMQATSTNINSIFSPKSSSTTKPTSILAPSTLSSTQQPTIPATKDVKPKKILSPEDLPAFKAAIQGSDLSKVGLIEVLKKKFPGRPAAAIKGTLETVAKRVGVKEVDKRWVLLD